MPMNFVDTVAASNHRLVMKKKKETPKYLFALREDIKDDKRFLPTRATSRSAGWDVACAFENHASYIVLPGEYVKIPLGLRCIPPEGYWLEMRPRSSTFVKKHMHALYGVVDNDYRGFLYFCATYNGPVPLTLEFGEKIGQAVVVKMKEMEISEVSNDKFDELCQQEDNERQERGFGSTDKKE